MLYTKKFVHKQHDNVTFAGSENDIKLYIITGY